MLMPFDEQQGETMMSSNRSLNTLTSRAKAGYFCLGLFLAVIGILIAWFINRRQATAAEAVKLSVLGFILSFVLAFTVVLVVLVFPIIAQSFV
jgi:uncharacterized Tic20 family protein